MRLIFPYMDAEIAHKLLCHRLDICTPLHNLICYNTQRYLDFLSGAIYALNGSYQKIDNKKFYFAPQGVSITIPKKCSNNNNRYCNQQALHSTESAKRCAIVCVPFKA